MLFGKVNGSHGVFSFLYSDEMRLTLPNGKVLRAFEKGYTMAHRHWREADDAPKTSNFFVQAFSKGSRKQALINGKHKGNAFTTNSNLEAAIKNDAGLYSYPEELANQDAGRHGGAFVRTAFAAAH